MIIQSQPMRAKTEPRKSSWGSSGWCGSTNRGRKVTKKTPRLGVVPAVTNAGRRRGAAGRGGTPPRQELGRLLPAGQPGADAEVGQVRAADDLQRVEERGRRLEQGSHAEGCGADPDDQGDGDSGGRQEDSPRAVGEGVPGYQRHVRTRRDGQHQGDRDEGQEEGAHALKLAGRAQKEEPRLAKRGPSGIDGFPFSLVTNASFRSGGRLSCRGGRS